MNQKNLITIDQHLLDQYLLNCSHTDAPQPGDYWTERWSVPYHVVLAVSDDNDKLTICRNKMASGPAHFTFDVRKSEVISKKDHLRMVTDATAPDKFVADVRPKRLSMVVDEWVALGRPLTQATQAVEEPSVLVPCDFLKSLLQTFEFIDGCKGVAVLDPIARKEQHEELKRLLNCK